MKTSVIEVTDMLSVLGVDELEKLMSQVAGVKSVTVNYAAGSATVRYDETRIEIADIKPAARRSRLESLAPTPAPVSAVPATPVVESPEEGNKTQAPAA
jgi:copper chaperone CopZ